MDATRTSPMMRGSFSARLNAGAVMNGLINEVAALTSIISGTKTPNREGSMNSDSRYMNGYMTKPKPGG